MALSQMMIMQLKCSSMHTMTMQQGATQQEPAVAVQDAWRQQSRVDSDFAAQAGSRALVVQSGESQSIRGIGAQNTRQHNS